MPIAGYEQLEHVSGPISFSLFENVKVDGPDVRNQVMFFGDRHFDPENGDLPNALKGLCQSCTSPSCLSLDDLIQDICNHSSKSNQVDVFLELPVMPSTLYDTTSSTNSGLDRQQKEFLMNVFTSRGFHYDPNKQAIVRIAEKFKNEFFFNTPKKFPFARFHYNDVRWSADFTVLLAGGALGISALKRAFQGPFSSIEQVLLYLQKMLSSADYSVHMRETWKGIPMIEKYPNEWNATRDGSQHKIARQLSKLSVANRDAVTIYFTRTYEKLVNDTFTEDSAFVYETIVTAILQQLQSLPVAAQAAEYYARGKDLVNRLINKSKSYVTGGASWEEAKQQATNAWFEDVTKIQLDAMFARRWIDAVRDIYKTGPEVDEAINKADATQALFKQKLISFIQKYPWFISDKIKEFFSEVQLILMDTYLIARLLFYAPQSNRIIVYAGDHHIQNYRSFLASQGMTPTIAQDRKNLKDPTWRCSSTLKARAGGRRRSSRRRTSSRKCQRRQLVSKSMSPKT